MNAIEIKNLSKSFRSLYAVDNLNMTVPVGAIYGFICGAAMLIAYLLGSVLGSAICGLSFDLGNLNIFNIAMCILSKIFLMQVFVAIFVLISVAAKQKAWLAICGSLFGGMLLFMMVPMITPLNSTPLNLVMCLAGGLMFNSGLGAVSKTVLNKTALV